MIYFIIFFQQFIASTTHLVAQDATRAVDPHIVLLFRGLSASCALLLILARSRKKRKRMEVPDRWKLLLLAVLNVPINQFLYLEGVGITSPANSALLYALTPLFVFFLALYNNQEKSSWRKWVGIVLALLGVTLIMVEVGIKLHPSYMKGNILVFLAVIAWSFYTFLGKPMVEKYGAIRVTALNMILGTLIYAPIALLTSDLSSISAITEPIWLRILYLGLISSVVNYALWFYALGKLEMSKLAIFQNLQPVMTIVMALLLGRAVLTGQFVGGSILTLVGVTIVQLG